MNSRTSRLLHLTARALSHGFLRLNARWLANLSYVGIPAVLACLTILALFAWRSDTAIPNSPTLSFSAIAFVPDDGGMQPAAAREALRGASRITSFDTQLAEAPVWFTFTPPPIPADAAGPPIVHFPSRHARTLSCWHGKALTPLGAATRAGASGALTLANAGFATTGVDLSGAPILCRGTFVGPAHLTVAAWSATDFRTSIRSFAIDMGMVEGGLTVLAVFMLLVAAINRESLYVVFAAWLLVSIRVGANSAGWDTLWMGHQIPTEWLDGLRKFTFASNFPLTAFLFLQLFKSDLAKLDQKPLIRTLELLYLPLCAAILLPYRYFLPALWIGSFIGYSIIIYFLSRILVTTHSRIALWFAASLVVTAIAGFAEVIKAAAGLPGSIPYFNSVTAALSSGLLAAMALAEQMRIEKSGRQGAELALQKSYMEVPTAFFTVNETGRILRGNPALGRLLGGPVLRGNTYWHQLFEAGAWTSLSSQLAENSRVQLRFESADHSAWYEVHASTSGDLIEGSINDVTEAVTATKKLTYLADHDQLTGALSRRAIEQALRGTIQHVGTLTPATLAYMDLDRFKTVNDLFGHTAGDEVLRQLGSMIAKSMGPDHLFGRIGGDEFLILLKGTSLTEGAAKCRALVDQVSAASFRVGDMAFRIGVSFGVVEVTEKVDVTDIISAADRACREAKRVFASGHVIAYGAGAPAFKEHDEERNLVAWLTPERAPDFLAIAMQPIMSLADPYGSLNFEVLLRARTSDGQALPAGRVITVAEAHGRIGVVDRWVLNTTLEWIDANATQLSNTRFITVNFSGASINDEKCMEDVYAMLRAHPLAASRICAEITEGVALADFDQTRRVLDRFREFEVKLALDDFGAGYTSFVYLSDLQADVLKIDGAIVESAARHPSRLSIVQAISDLSRNLGMRCVAEWVEDAPTLLAMSEVGIDYIQGFTIARPMAPAEILLGTHAAHWITDQATVKALADILAASTSGPGNDIYGPTKNLH